MVSGLAPCAASQHRQGLVLGTDCCVATRGANRSIGVQRQPYPPQGCVRREFLIIPALATPGIHRKDGVRKQVGKTLARIVDAPPSRRIAPEARPRSRSLRRSRRDHGRVDSSSSVRPIRRSGKSFRATGAPRQLSPPATISHPSLNAYRDNYTMTAPRRKPSTTEVSSRGQKGVFSIGRDRMMSDERCLLTMMTT